MAPTATCQGPRGTQTTPFPTVEWAYTPDPSTLAAQASAEVLVFELATVVAEGFDPDDDSGDAYWSGTATDGLTSEVDQALPDGDYEAWIKATDTDDAESDWCSVRFTVATPLGNVAHVAAARGRRLGCGAHRVFIQARGGGRPIIELPWSRIGYGRRIDEVSAASVTVPIDAATDDACCYALSTLTPWQHELAVWRDGEEAWVGVVGEPSYERMGVTIPARDLLEWFERRLLPFDRTFVNIDLGVIFRQYALDALSQDTSPNITVNPGATLVRGDRSVRASDYRYAMDEMQELARNGVDFTAIGRTIVVGGVEIPTDAIGPFDDTTLDNAKITPRGLIAASEVTVVGARPHDSDEPLVGVAGGFSATLGLVQVVHDESAIEDQASLTAAAETRHDLLANVPVYVSGDLMPEAQAAFADLIPGARAELAVTAACREAVGTWRLSSVDVAVAPSEGGGVSEVVSVVFEPLGTVAA